MNWNPKELEELFACNEETCARFEDGYCFGYLSKRLKYNLVVRDKEDEICISADPTLPFGGDSLFEFCVSCDMIALMEDPYHPEFKALGFWYGGSKELRNLRLTLMKRPDGDLKVWPVYPRPNPLQS